MHAPSLVARLSSLTVLLVLHGCAESETAPARSNTVSDAEVDSALDTNSGSADTSESSGDTSVADTGTADTGEGSADTTVEPACTALTAGSWNVNGSCIGMLMTGEMTLDASGCSFTLGGWNMAMDIPAGGTVEGDTVTFTGRNWTGCTGTVASTGMRVDATCPAASGSPACSFTMLAR